MSKVYHPLVQGAMANLPETDSRCTFRFLPLNTHDALFARQGMFGVDDNEGVVGVEVFPQPEEGIIWVYAHWPDNALMFDLDEQANDAQDPTFIYKGPYRNIAAVWPHHLYPLHRAWVMVALGLADKSTFN